LVSRHGRSGPVAEGDDDKVFKTVFHEIARRIRSAPSLGKASEYARVLGAGMLVDWLRFRMTLRGPGVADSIGLAVWVTW
jgi:hypothetical protein